MNSETNRAGGPPRRDELVGIFMEEWRRGCHNTAYPQGFFPLRGDFAGVVPEEVFDALLWLYHGGRSSA